MGGAVVLLLHRKKPEFWEGAILIAPMCKVNRFTHIITSSIISYKSRIINISNYNCDERQIAEEMKPPKPVISMMNLVIHLIPSWKSILPGPDIINLAIKQPHKRQEVRTLLTIGLVSDTLWTWQIHSFYGLILYSPEFTKHTFTQNRLKIIQIAILGGLAWRRWASFLE